MAIVDSLRGAPPPPMYLPRRATVMVPSTLTTENRFLLPALLLAGCETTPALRLFSKAPAKEDCHCEEQSDVAIRFPKEKNNLRLKLCFIPLRTDGRESVHSRLSCIGASPAYTRRGIIKGGGLYKATLNSASFSIFSCRPRKDGHRGSFLVWCNVFCRFILHKKRCC